MSKESSPDISLPYSPLSTTVLSVLLEADGQVDGVALQQKVEVEAAISQPVMPFIENALLKHGLVELQDDVLTATEAGVDYINQRTTYMDHPPRRAPRFNPTKYNILSYLQDEAGPDGWLFGPNGHTTSIFMDLSENLDMSYEAVTRRLSDYDKCQLIEKGFSHTQNGKGGPSVTNIRLTQQGEAELEEMRLYASNKIDELLEAPMDDQLKPGEPAGDYLFSALTMVTDEINNMLVELGEEPKDFSRFVNLPEEEAREALDRFRLVAERLEKRIDQSGKSLAAA